MSTITVPENDMEMIEYADQPRCQNCQWAYEHKGLGYHPPLYCRGDWAMTMESGMWRLPVVPATHHCYAWKRKEGKK